MFGTDIWGCEARGLTVSRRLVSFPRTRGSGATGAKPAWTHLVIPAHAGIWAKFQEMPACAGMTVGSTPARARSEAAGFLACYGLTLTSSGGAAPPSSISPPAQQVVSPPGISMPL